MIQDLTDPVTLLLGGFASARLALLISRDDIFEPVRDRIFHLSPPENNPGNGWYYQNMRRPKAGESTKFRAKLPRYQRRWMVEPSEQRRPGYIGRLVACPDCSGVWTAAAVAAFVSLSHAHTFLPVLAALSFALCVVWAARRF